MIRILGFVAILIGTMGCGLSIIKERKTDVEECKEWLYVLSVVENEMAFQKSTLPEICFRISKQSTINRKKRIFLENVYNRMQEKNGESFGTVWEEEFKLHELGKECNREIEKEIQGIGKKLFFEDVAMQRNIVQTTMQKIEYYMKKKQRENETENKVVLCMSVMSGLLITILLI